MRHSIKNYIVHTDLWEQSDSFVREKEASKVKKAYVRENGKDQIDLQQVTFWLDGWFGCFIDGNKS
jgi:hypothetical protein